MVPCPAKQDGQPQPEVRAAAVHATTGPPTAQKLASMLHARRAGPVRWQARCPAYPDRSPSLSVREGTAGRVLVVN